MSEAATQSHAAPECVTIDRCRVCGTPSPQVVLELGELPLANSLLTDKPSDPGAEPRFSLTLAACSECGLAQILETVRPDILFRDYLYFSSFSETMLAHAKGEVEMLTPGDHVNVFLPTTPNPTSGFLLFVPVSELVPLDMGVEDAVKMVISGGIVTPEMRASSLPKKSSSDQAWDNAHQPPIGPGVKEPEESDKPVQTEKAN